MQPPYGMEKDIDGVQNYQYYPHTTAQHILNQPYGRPGCFKEMKACGLCPWKLECANAEKGV